MNPGKLDHLVSLCRLDTSLDSIGGVVPTWSFVSAVWGEWLPSTGREYIAAQARIAEADGVLRIRWRADIVETWRVLVAGGLYEVAAPPVPVGRRSFLDLTLRSVRVAEAAAPLVNVFDVSLAQGTTSKDIVFPIAFQSAPQGLYVQLIVPTGQETFTISVGVPTANGVTVDFGAAVPASGYKLSVQAFQYQLTYLEPLVEGTAAKDIIFPSEFPSVPRGLKVTLVPPSDGYEFTTALVVKSLTTTGFRLEYGANVPGLGYQALIQLSL